MKIVREHINEKFSEDSNPIHDMGIGLKTLWRKTFNNMSITPRGEICAKYFSSEFGFSSDSLNAGTVLYDMLSVALDDRNLQENFEKICKKYYGLNKHLAIKEKIAQILKDKFSIQVDVNK